MTFASPPGKSGWPAISRSYTISPFGPETLAPAGAAKAVTHSAADAVMARMARSTPARRAAQRFRSAAGTWAAPLALATPAARISNAPAAAANAAARLIRLRIATPHFPQGGRLLADAGDREKPGSGPCHTRRALRGNLVLPAPLGPTLARTQQQRQGRRRAALPCHDKTFNLDRTWL